MRSYIMSNDLSLLPPLSLSSLAQAGRPSFQAYELPDRALLFQPPKNKTEVLKPVSFLASARVLSSVKDNDSYVGFVGVQDKDIRVCNITIVLYLL